MPTYPTLVSQVARELCFPIWRSGFMDPSPSLCLELRYTPKCLPLAALLYDPNWGNNFQMHHNPQGILRNQPTTGICKDTHSQRKSIKPRLGVPAAIIFKDGLQVPAAWLGVECPEAANVAPAALH